MVKVAVLDDYQQIAESMADWSRLPAGSEVQFFKEHLFDDDARAERLKDFDVIVGVRERTPFRAGLLSRLPNLKLLITTGMGNASFDVNAARDLGIEVCGTRGMRTPTAQLTWGLILGLVRHIPEEDRNLKAGGWQSTIGPDIYGKTLGIIGLGNLGTQVAAVGRAFGMEVIAWSRNMTQERAAEHGARAVSKDEMFSQSDILTIHVPLNDSSRGMIDARELGLMKPAAYLINTSRGPIIDEKALLDTLENRRIAGAALDVFDQEPLPVDHPLRRMPNTILTPHLGYVVTDQYKIYFEDVIEDINAFVEGNPVRQVGLRSAAAH